MNYHVATFKVISVVREIFAFKYFCVIIVRVSNFHHKVQEVKIIHGVFYFRVLNFNGEYFPIYGMLFTVYCVAMDTTERIHLISICDNTEI